MPVTVKAISIKKKATLDAGCLNLQETVGNSRKRIAINTGHT
jgi:hypothetical protein